MQQDTRQFLFIETIQRLSMYIVRQANRQMDRNEKSGVSKTQQE